jgi:hypothetical protein
VTVFETLASRDLVNSPESHSRTRLRSPIRCELMQNKFFNFSFNFTFMISAVLIALQSPDLKADESQQSQFQDLQAAAFVPFSFWSAQLKSQIEGSTFELQQKQDSFHYAEPDGSIQIDSGPVNYIMNLTTQNMSHQSNDSLHFDLSLGQANVEITNFNLRALVRKDLGFGNAILKLDMHCDGIGLKIKNNNPIAINVGVYQGQFNLTELNWNLKNSQVETSLIGCKEIAGFDQMLKSQVQQFIEQNLVINSLQQMVNSQLNELIFQKISAALSTYAEKFNLGPGQTFHFDDENHLWIHSSANVTQTFSSEEIEKIKQSRKPVLLISRTTLEDYAKYRINEVLKTQIISSKTYSSLNRLTCSRFFQFFIWPSLMSLSKCFEMKVLTQVQSLKISDFKKLNLNLTLGSWASGETHNIAFFETIFETSLRDKEITIRSFRAQSTPDFINWSRRSKRISVSTIRPGVDAVIKSLVADLKSNTVFQMIQKNSTFKELSSEILLIEVD